MLASNGRAVLIDLGVARHTTLTSLTATGNTWGTRGYLSPEQYSAAKGLTLKSDLFALGVVVLESLIGTHPTGRNQVELINARQPAAALCPQLPVAVATFVDRMLHREPFARPRAEEVVSMFEPLTQGPTTW